RLSIWAGTAAVAPDLSERSLARLLYRHGMSGLSDRIRLDLVRERANGNESAAAGYRKLLSVLSQWTRPRFPLSGRDLVSIGMAPGTTMGLLLERLETEWIDSDFTLDRDALLARAHAAR